MNTYAKLEGGGQRLIGGSAWSSVTDSSAWGYPRTTSSGSASARSGA